MIIWRANIWSIYLLRIRCNNHSLKLKPSFVYYQSGLIYRLSLYWHSKQTNRKRKLIKMLINYTNKNPYPCECEWNSRHRAWWFKCWQKKIHSWIVSKGGSFRYARYWCHYTYLLYTWPIIANLMRKSHTKNFFLSRCALFFRNGAGHSVFVQRIHANVKNGTWKTKHVTHIIRMQISRGNRFYFPLYPKPCAINRGIRCKN